MNLPASVERAAARCNALTMRERALVAAATLVAVVMGWLLGVLDPMTARQRALMSEMSTIQEALDSSGDGPPGTATAALEKEAQLKQELEQINVKLTSSSAGLIPPERMVQVIRDVLSHQQGIVLVSLHNKAVTPLVPPSDAQPARTDDSVDQETATDRASPAADGPVETGPYVHPVELVIEGRYLDIVTYMRALEALPWRFHWQLLELSTRAYPINRVRIEISTLSMEKDWIGV
jgi:MSHA biogenesis protein MshJ